MEADRNLLIVELATHLDKCVVLLSCDQSLPDAITMPNRFFEAKMTSWTRKPRLASSPWLKKPHPFDPVPQPFIKSCPKGLVKEPTWWSTPGITRNQPHALSLVWSSRSVVARLEPPIENLNPANWQPDDEIAAAVAGVGRWGRAEWQTRSIGVHCLPAFG